MTDEVYKYFAEQYKKAPFVMAGKLPDDFSSKEEVDQWVKTWRNAASTVRKYIRSGNHIDDPDDF